MTSSYHLKDKKRTVPKLRFKEYNDEWVEKRIEKVLKIKHGKDKKAIEKKDGIYPILATSGEIGRTNTFLWDKPCVLIGRKGTINKPQYMETPFWTVDTLFYSEVFKENNAKYLYYLFNTINWKKYDESTGVPSLSARTIERIKITISDSIQEQEKIASFLTLIDKKIEKQKELVELLKKYKRGLLSQIFSRKLRFKDEEEPWQKVKFDKLGYFLGGGTPSKNNTEYWSGTIPWISSSDISENDIANINMSRFITQNAIDNSATKICPNDTICIVSRVGVGKLAISKECICTSQDFVNFINTTNNNTFYIAYYLKEIMKEKVLKTQGTSIKGITSSEIKNIQIALPTIEIQNKVAFISSYMDLLINKHENLYKLMLQYKKGLLQQIFI